MDVRIFLLIPALCLVLLDPATVAQEDDFGTENPYLKLGKRFEFVITGDPLIDYRSVRDWEASDGRKLKAKILEAKNDAALFLLANGNTTTIPFTRFCDRDQRFIVEWTEVNRFFNTGYQKPRNLTGKVEAGISDGAFAKEGKIHETKNFRFECDVPLNATTVKDFSRMFEATYQVVRALPIALEVDEPIDGRFQVRLFSRKSDYEAAGGPAEAAGVYLLKERQILVPLESLGIKEVGKTFRHTGDYDPSTLIHEITHAVTHQWLNYMPMWVAEGLADYVAAIPYRDGAFSMNEISRGIYHLVGVNFGGDPLRFALIEPSDFIYLDKNQFMNRPSEEEQVIELTAVKPYQIRLQGEAEPKESTTTPMMVSSGSSKKPFDGIVTPSITVPLTGVDESSLVVRRYSSSMVLLHELLRSGQATSLRKFLFAYLQFDWDSEKYIADYNQNLVEYQDKVKSQIAEFDGELKKFNNAVNSYNEAVRKKNAGIDVPLPPIPSKPDVPEAIPVPEILANPRSPEEFSRKVFRHASVRKYLEVPERLAVQ